MYLVSAALDYSKLICSDAGPNYAISMKWNWDYLNKDYRYEDDVVYVIDNRISEEECYYLKEAILSSKATFVLKIVDPNYEWGDQYYYQWLFLTLSFSNVYLLSVYEPKELTLVLTKLYPCKLIYLPYPYDSAKEVPLKDLAKRKNKIIISGSTHMFYPLRNLIIKKIKRVFVRRIFYSVLKHPGYPDTNEKGNFTHSIIGKNYIDFLSKYKVMFVCPARSKIELLKFHECAYAGCLPTGAPPDSFPQEIKDLFVNIDNKKILISTFNFFLKWSEKDHIKRLTAYRAYLQKERNADHLNQLFQQQLEKKLVVKSN